MVMSTGPVSSFAQGASTFEGARRGSENRVRSGEARGKENDPLIGELPVTALGESSSKARGSRFRSHSCNQKPSQSKNRKKKAEEIELEEETRPLKRQALG